MMSERPEAFDKWAYAEITRLEWEARQWKRLTIIFALATICFVISSAIRWFSS